MSKPKDATAAPPSDDQWNMMVLYLLVLRILKSATNGSKAVIDAAKSLQQLIADKAGPKALADGICYLVKSLGDVANDFLTSAEAHFAAHAKDATTIGTEELQDLIKTAEAELLTEHCGKEAHLGGGGILQGLKNSLPTILWFLKLFGVPVPPITLPTSPAPTS